MKKTLIAAMMTTMMLVSACGTTESPSEPKKTEVTESEAFEHGDFIGIVGPGKRVPYPNVGRVVDPSEFDTIGYYDIIDMPLADLDAYKLQCIDAGFEYDVVSNSDYFRGETEDGYMVTVKYVEATDTEIEHFSVMVSILNNSEDVESTEN